MARKRANISDLLNDLTARTLFNKYKLITMNAFNWGNLPEGMTERHIERNLFNDGACIFFRPAGLDYMALKVAKTGRVNTYGDPLSYRAIGIGQTWEVNADDCVVIENNMLRLATYDFVMFYVNKLTEAERTMDVNVKANKTPIIVLCDDKNVLTFKQLFSQVDGNIPAIFADKNINLDSITALDTKVQFLGNELMDYKRSVEGELLTFLGINNIPIDKKERLVTDEAESNNQLIASFFELQLEARKRACEAINNKWSLNITVEKRQPIVEKSVENVENSEVVPHA